MDDFVMYKDCKKILRYMKKSKDYEVDLTIFEDKIKDFDSLIIYLDEYGYINRSKVLGPTKAELTFVGRRYTEENFISFRNFIFSSMVIPVIVSLITFWIFNNLN